MTPYHKRQTPITKRMAEDMLVRNLAVRKRPAVAMMLHTWNQRLDHHPHVHALIPGSGPSLDGTTWVPCPSCREIFGNFASGSPEKKRRDTG